MTAALLVSFAAILAIALATPRQADHWLGRRWNTQRRRMLRWAGFTLLAVSFLLLPGGTESARALISWVGGLAVQALAIALLVQQRRRIPSGTRLSR